MSGLRRQDLVEVLVADLHLAHHHVARPRRRALRVLGLVVVGGRDRWLPRRRRGGGLRARVLLAAAVSARRDRRVAARRARAADQRREAEAEPDRQLAQSAARRRRAELDLAFTVDAVAHADAVACAPPRALEELLRVALGERREIDHGRGARRAVAAVAFAAHGVPRFAAGLRDRQVMLVHAALNARGGAADLELGTDEEAHGVAVGALWFLARSVRSLARVRIRRRRARRRGGGGDGGERTVGDVLAGVLGAAIGGRHVGARGRGADEQRRDAEPDRQPLETATRRL